MINTSDFIDFLENNSIKKVCAVPCNHAQSLIDSLLTSSKVDYVPCANEAVAYSISFGYSLAGTRSIVVCQSSGFPNLINGLVSLGKAYNISFPIVTSWRNYSNNEEIQHKHLAEHLPNLVAACGCDFCDLESNYVDKFVSGYESFKVFYIDKNTFSPALEDKLSILNSPNIPDRMRYLNILVERYEYNNDVTIVSSTGHICREVNSFKTLKNHFMMIGNMGGGVSLSYGLSDSSSVIFLGGDAEFVMHAGGMATISRYRNSIKNPLLYICFDNLVNKSTGNQPTLQEHVNYSKVAAGYGFKCIKHTVANLNDFKSALDICDASKDMIFMHVRCALNNIVERPTMNDLYSFVY